MTVALRSTETTLERLGWGAHETEAFHQYHDRGLVAGRVAVQHRGAYVVATETGDVEAEPAGRLRYEAAGAAGLPVVGDWVALRRAPYGGRALVEAVLPRRTAFSRKVPERELQEQVLAANVDVVFVVSSLNRELKSRRLERYLTLAWESGGRPAIVLTKSDLCDDVPGRLADVEAVAFGVPVHVVSGLTGEGLAALPPYFAGHRTAVFLGSSGVGKSTLVNLLLGQERQPVREIRAADDRGRHTTTRRELLLLPGGGAVIDTPGMRELQLWESEDGLDAAFGDIAALAERCRFRDCSHEREPGCAIREALRTGALAADRWASYGRLQRELHALELKGDKRAASEARRRRRAQARQRRRPKRW